MAFNDKKEWVNAEDSQKLADEFKGYTVCFCGDGVLLHQAGFDCEMKKCEKCMNIVAERKGFFK